MARYGSEKIRGHGIPEALEAILLGGSMVEPKVALLKPISSAISIGTGGPFGAEGPIIMTGGAFGSIIAQFFHLTAAERKTLLVAGAAAGMAAVFATPIAATLAGGGAAAFRMAAAQFHPGRGRAVVASVLRVPLLGAGPIFPVAAARAHSARRRFSGRSRSASSRDSAPGLLTVLVYFCEDLFQKLPIHWMWWPAIGALFVGLGGWFDPRVLGVGYYLIDGLLKGHIVGAAILSPAGLQSACLVDLVRLGHFGRRAGAVAHHRRRARRDLSVNGCRSATPVSGRWSAMAGMMGGTMRSPSHRHVFHARADARISMRSPRCSAAPSPLLAVTVLLMRRSILTEKLARRGQHIAREYSVDLFELMRVNDVMDRDFTLLPANTPLPRYSARVASGDPLVCSHQGTLLVDEAGDLAGIITRGDIVRAFAHSRDESYSVLQAGQTQVIVDLSRRNALRRDREAAAP